MKISCSLAMLMDEKAMLSRESHHWKKAIQNDMRVTLLWQIHRRVKKKKFRMLSVVKTRQEVNRLYSGRTPGPEHDQHPSVLFLL